MDDGFRSGFIAIVGRPNMGKSTFLNRVLGRKVAIVTPKAQTTRTRILGVRTTATSQMVFLDTPGIHLTGGKPLNRAMVKTALNACREVDGVLYFVEAGRGLLPADLEIIRQLPHGAAPLFLVVNKVDQSPRERLMTRLAALQGRDLPFREVIPLSALTGDNVERLLAILEGLLPPGPRYFPDGQFSDQPERFIAAEVVREKLFLNLHQELPYSLAVRILQVTEEEAGMRLEGEILVERESQKGMVIGKRGAMLKSVGQAARKELEGLLGLPVYLDLRVRVAHRWSSDPRALQDLGYLES